MGERHGGLAVLSNDRLSPRINWSTLGPPLLGSLAARTGVTLVRPPALSRSSAGLWRAESQAIRSADSMFWMQLSSRPEAPLTAAMLAAGRIRRSAYVIDAWPYSLRKIAWFARTTRLTPCFVAMREAYDALVVLAPTVPFVHLPFGVDLDTFSPSTGERDIFAFSMGRLHQPLHAALSRYCDDRGLRYVVSTGGRIKDPAELGEIVGRSRYFVVTPPDVDHPERAGGFSPLVMRYLEGLAAGARLLGTLPRSGEFESMLPVESILQVAPDGSDLARRLDADAADTDAAAATESATAVVRAAHGWNHRADAIAAALL